MYLGDKRKPAKYHNLRMNYDIVIDNEKLTLSKLSRNLGFFTIIPLGKVHEAEIVYDTEKKLLSGSGLILRKKMDVNRTYFSLIRISSLNKIDLESREKKSFLGECEVKDQPSDFPVQIADAINKIFNNLFTIDLVEVVKHCSPYIHMDIFANKYKIVSGTGYEAEFQFEELRVRDIRTGRKAKKRNFSIKMLLDPNYAKERQEILTAIDKYCKELVFVRRNRFEIAQVAVRALQSKADGAQEKKKSRKQIKQELAAKNQQEQN